MKLSLQLLIAIVIALGVSNRELPAQEPQSARPGHLIEVPLPIDDLVSRNIRQSLKKIAQSAPAAVRPENRAVVVLEFDVAGGQTGRGSELEACQSLARLLTSPELKTIETVAWLPRSESLLPVDEDTFALRGHAVLVAIAANQFAIAPGNSFGDAGADEETIDPLLTAVYQTIGQKRLKLPLPVVDALLDKRKSLYRAVPPDQGAAIYVDGAGLKELESKQNVVAQTLSRAGDPLLLESEQLEQFRLIELVPDSKSELARRLRLNPNSLDTPIGNNESYNAVQIEVPFLIDDQAETWLMENLNRELARGVNLVIFVIDENIGDPDACLSLASRIAELDSQGVETVAFVRGPARMGIGVVALACNRLIMAPEVKLGGIDPEINEPLEPPEIERLKGSVMTLAETVDRDWSLMLAMFDPGLQLTQYVERSTRQMHLFSDEEFLEFGDPELLTPLGPMSLDRGLNATTAEKLGIARLVAEDMGQIQTFLELDTAPRSVELTATTRSVNQFARFLANPFISLLLLMGGFFFLSSEMSAPGLSVPGLLSICCFGLYFWSHFLDGSAIWLEVLMFGLGIVCILLEIFVIPGFGVFGIGGLVLVLLSLILAAQDFVIPTSSEQIRQLPYSLMPVTGGALGVLIAAIVLRNALPKSKYLRQFMLNTEPDTDKTGLESRRDPEAIVDWSYLVDERGEAITRLSPAGKARINGEVYNVISTGQLVDKGARIVVVEAIGNRVVVQAETEPGS